MVRCSKRVWLDVTAGDGVERYRMDNNNVAENIIFLYQVFLCIVYFSE